MFIQFIVATIATVSLSIAMIIDSTAWHIRGLARVDERGLFISKTNIFLYGGRFFSLLYMTSLAYLVDVGVSAVEIISVSAFGFFASAVANHCILGLRTIRKPFVQAVTCVLRLPQRESVVYNNNFRMFSTTTLGNHLFLFSSMATFIFSMGISIPYVIASVYPEYRMTFNNLGQIINSLGMLMVLLLIDSRMYRDWDRNELTESNEYYTASRTFGLGFASLLYITITSIFVILK